MVDAGLLETDDAGVNRNIRRPVGIWRRIKTPSPQGKGASRVYLWAPALPLFRRALNIAAPKAQIVTSPAGSGTAAAGPVV
jgi:hypothetical protein